MTDPMTTPPLDLTALREYAKAATPGPWEAYDANEGMDRAYSPMWCVANEEFHNPTTGDDEDWMGVEIHVGDKADSDHIATFDPPTVLALLDRVEAAERDLAAVTVSRDGWQTRTEAAEKAVAKVRALRNVWFRELENMDQLVPLEEVIDATDTALDNHTPETETTP